MTLLRDRGWVYNIDSDQTEEKREIWEIVDEAEEINIINNRECQMKKRDKECVEMLVKKSMPKDLLFDDDVARKMHKRGKRGGRVGGRAKRAPETQRLLDNYKDVESIIKNNRYYGRMLIDKYKVKISNIQNYKKIVKSASFLKEQDEKFRFNDELEN